MAYKTSAKKKKKQQSKNEGGYWGGRCQWARTRMLYSSCGHKFKKEKGNFWTKMPLFKNPYTPWPIRELGKGTKSDQILQKI